MDHTQGALISITIQINQHIVHLRLFISGSRVLVFQLNIPKFSIEMAIVYL